MSGKGIVLFGHGARNAEYLQPFHAIRDAMLASDPRALVEIGFLELTPPPLEAAIDALAARGATQVVIVPIFFAPGRHVLKDLPQLVANAMDRHPGLQIEVSPAVGESATVVAAMARFALGDAA